MKQDALLTPHTDVRLAHEQMRVHRVWRAERCVWNAAAYRTLGSGGRPAPQTVSPRERAAARGVQFPPPDEPGRTDRSPVAHTRQEVLKRLSDSATPPEPFRG
ncbi:hypothetical protein AB0H00_17075 [Nocardia sp. NPDC023852]|uniref:hypothetical protein n=1 Tax=Nocardia sp. NPDC023852 TaxID=3154697 RepID=UPI0033FC8C52